MLLFILLFLMIGNDLNMSRTIMWCFCHRWNLIPQCGWSCKCRSGRRGWFIYRARAWRMAILQGPGWTRQKLVSCWQREIMLTKLLLMSIRYSGKAISENRWVQASLTKLIIAVVNSIFLSLFFSHKYKVLRYED